MPGKKLSLERIGVRFEKINDTNYIIRQGDRYEGRIEKLNTGIFWYGIFDRGKMVYSSDNDLSDSFTLCIARRRASAYLRKYRTEQEL